MTDVSLPPLKGIVLAGGLSTRMGTDKGLIEYHGQTQRSWTAQRLAPFCGEVFVSIRADQSPSTDFQHYLIDTQAQIGPLAGLLAAIQHDAQAAWLIAACDLPQLSTKSIQQLVSVRNPMGCFTAFQTADGQIQPLLSIWEPSSFGMIRANVAEGRFSLRRIMESAEGRLVTPLYPDELLNANFPDQFAP